MIVIWLPSPFIIARMWCPFFSFCAGETGRTWRSSFNVWMISGLTGTRDRILWSIFTSGDSGRVQIHSCMVPVRMGIVCTNRGWKSFRCQCEKTLANNLRCNCSLSHQTLMHNLGTLGVGVNLLQVDKTTERVCFWFQLVRFFLSGSALEPELCGYNRSRNPSTLSWPQCCCMNLSLHICGFLGKSTQNIRNLS